MLKRLNQINVKYAIAFITVAVAMFAVVAVDLLLVHTLKERMREFGGPFIDSTSAVLNADRDLYQAGAPATRDGLYLVPRVVE